MLAPLRTKPQLRKVTGVLLLFACFTIPARADKGDGAFKQGRDLEAKQNYEAAYDAFQRAYAANPKNTEYRAALTRIRFLTAAEKVHRGLLLQQAGDLEQALKLFEEAARIDPSSPIASQQVSNTRNMIHALQGHRKGPSASESSVNPDVLDVQGPVKLTNISNAPITLKLTEDSRMVYGTIGRLAGVNVLFDPDYTSRRLSIELNRVTLAEALDLVAAESKSFWKPMTTNTIFVAADNPAKRKELEVSVVKTFYLSNLTAPTELQDVVNTLRAILDVNRVQQLISQEAVVIRGTPDQVLLAEKIVSDFDRAAPEVVIDLALMQVSRDKVHTLGISPPTSATVQLQSNTSSSSSSSSSSSTSSSSSSSSSSSTGINLNTLANLNATDFTATISSANATALLTDSNTKIIQNPQIRSLNGQKATIKIGDRVPIATGSTQSGISGVSVSGLNTTQFQYIDVGVNVDVTPHIHADGDITLKMSLDVSSVTSYQSIGGISEPVIGQRKVEHEIRLKDGEVSLLGGILEQHDTQSLTGLPGLSQIPILKYLFSQKNNEVSSNEIVFVVIPHIVRRKDIDEFNRRTIDVGTANSVHLRHAAPPVPESNANDTSTIVPGGTAPDEVEASFKLDPAAVSVAKGSTFMVNVELNGAHNVQSVPLEVTFDKQGLELLNISNGDFLSKGDQVVALVHREDNLRGAVDITASRPSDSGGVSGHGVVTTLTFQAKTTGQFPVKIARGAIVQPDQQIRTASGSEIQVVVR